MKILLAEDDANISTIAKLALEKLGGHNVTVADNGNSALEMARGETFDVILLDEMMPGLNGLAVAREYLRDNAAASPVIFLSAKSQESDIRAFNGLAHGYIAKPFDPMTLCQQIEKVLSQRRETA